MNVSTLTIANMLSQPDRMVQVGSGAGATQQDTRFYPVHEQPQPPAEATPRVDRSCDRSDIAGRPASEPRKDFKDVVDKQTKSGSPEQAGEGRESKRQSVDSKASGQSQVGQPADAQSPAAIEYGSEVTATASRPKSSERLAQLVERARTEKARAGLAETPESPEIELSGTALNKQLGSDSAKAGALKDIAAASADKLAAAKSQTANVQTAPTPGETKQLTLKASIVDAAKTAGSGKQNAVAADSEATAKSPSAVSGEIVTGRSGQTKSLGESAAAANAGRTPTSNTDEETAAKAAQTQQPSVSRTDQITARTDNLAKNAQEPLTTAETEPGGAVRQGQTRPFGASGKNAGNPGNNTGNSTSDPAQSQTGTARAGTEGSSESHGGPLADSAKVFSQMPAQTAAAEQAPIFAVQTEPTTAAEQPQTTSADRLGAVGSQVLESVRSSLSQQTGDKEITIQLHPPELGKVSVKLQEHGTELTGTLEVSKAQTRTEIEQVLPELIRSLADSGVAIKRLEVVLSQNEQSGSQASRDPLLQDGAFGQRDSANPGQSGHEQKASQTYYGPAGRSGYQYQSSADPYEMLVTNTSINMLV